MNVIKEWILVGAGLAIGKLIVAVVVIAILIVILVLLSIIEENTK
jgi:hypothetical protein